jgi:hypothetical protein
VDPGAQLGAAVKEVIFDFLNARLVSFDLDDLSHETSDANIMTMQFDYDWMEIVDVGTMTEVDGPLYSIAVPGVGGAPVDISVNGGGYSSPGSGDPFMDIISRQAGRAVQQVTSETINRGVQAIAGKGSFGTALGAQVSNALGSTIGRASTATLNQSLARPSRVNIVTDSAEGGQKPVIGVTSSKGD